MNIKKDSVNFDFYPVVYNRRRSCFDDYINSHEALEILCFYEGGCSVLNDEAIVEVNEGDIVVINSESLHSVRCARNPAMFSCLMIDAQFCSSMGFDVSSVLFVQKLKSQRIVKSIEAIEREFVEQKPYYMASVRLELVSILLELFRNHTENSDSLNSYSSNETKIAMDIMKYIKKNYSEDLSFKSLEKKFGYTKSYLSRIFKKVVGATISECIKTTRLTEAKKLLIKTDLSVELISGKCGFKDSSYFGKTFKKNYGYSPLQYRKTAHADGSRTQSED